MPENGSRSALIANHIETMRIYHECRIRHRALACTVTGLHGVTINGSKPRHHREPCDEPVEPPQSSTVQPVDKWFGSFPAPYACGVRDTAENAVCVPRLNAFSVSVTGRRVDLAAFRRGVEKDLRDGQRAFTGGR